MLHVEIGFWLSGGQRGQRCVASGPARGLSATDLKLDFAWLGLAWTMQWWEHSSLCPYMRGRGGGTVLKKGFTQTFPGNQDVAVK